MSATAIDDDLLLNRILDKYGEAMRPHMKPKVRDRFDALTPEARRALCTKKLGEVYENE